MYAFKCLKSNILLSCKNIYIYVYGRFDIAIDNLDSTTTNNILFYLLLIKI